MAQYIDKAAVIAEIEKRYDEYISSIFKRYDACKEARAQELGKILTIINTLEVKEAIECVIEGTIIGTNGHFGLARIKGEYKEGDKIKVINLKED